MEYPKLTRAQKNNCKLSEEQIKEIQELHQQGMSMRAIAKQFKISKTTVKYWVDEEFKKKDKLKATKRTAEKRKTIEGKIKENERRAISIKIARKNIKELQEYHAEEKINN